MSWIEFYNKANEMEREEIFSTFLKLDESHLFPILGRFNATQMAIKNLFKFEEEGEYYLQGIELYLFLDDEISKILNDEL